MIHIENTSTPDISRLREIRNVAQELRFAAGVAGETMLPLNTIANFLQFRIILFQPRENLGDVFGAMDYTHRTIFIDALESVGSQRFIIAHVLGHLFLHSEHQDEPGWIYDYRSSHAHLIDSLREQEADLFALELLMPMELVRQHMNKNSRNLQDMASEFQVSMDVLQRRLDVINVEAWNAKMCILAKIPPGEKPKMIDYL